MKDSTVERRRWLALTGGPLLATAFPSARGAGSAAVASGAPLDADGRGTFDVKNFGAAGDGKAKDTAAIQKAIDACHEARGGIVYFPPGSYYTGTIRLKSNVTLYLHVGATIQGSRELADYELVGEVRAGGQSQPRHLIFAKDAENLGIAGPGKIDGSGSSFWRPMTRTELEEVLLQRPEGGKVAQDWYRWLPRPAQMLEFQDCKNLRIQDVRIENAPFWALHPVRCDSVFINGITIYSPLYAPNSDGIDIDACSNVMISNCNIYSCDDAIAIYSRGPAGTPWRARNITVTNCVLCTTCNALKINFLGPQASVENVTFSNCALYGDPHPKDTGGSQFWPELQDFRTMSGIHLDTPTWASIAGVAISNITMQDVRNPIFMRIRKPNPEDKSAGGIRDIMIDNVMARGQSLPCLISGLPGRDIQGVGLSNVRITARERGRLDWARREWIPEFELDYPEAIMLGNLPSYGMYCRHVNGLRMRNVEYVLEEPDMRPALMLEDVKNLDVDGFAATPPASGEPLIRLKQVRRAFLRGCSAAPDTKTFLQVEGDQSEKITLIGNDLSEASVAVSVATGVKPGTVFEMGNRLPKS